MISAFHCLPFLSALFLGDNTCTRTVCNEILVEGWVSIYVGLLCNANEKSQNQEAVIQCSVSFPRSKVTEYIKQYTVHSICTDMFMLFGS